MDLPLVEKLLDLQVPSELNLCRSGDLVLYSTKLPSSQRKGEHPISDIWVAETSVANSACQLTKGLYNEHSPKWRPTGQSSFAFLTDRAHPGENAALYLHHLGTRPEEALTPPDSDSGVSNIVWSSDGQYIAYLSADEKSQEQKKRELKSGNAAVWGQDWPYNRPRIINVETREITTLVSIDAHVTGLAWNDDNTKIAFTSTNNPDIESADETGTMISIVDITTKAISQLCNYPTIIEGLLWAGDRIYFTGPGDPPIASSALMVNSIVLSAEKSSYQRVGPSDTECVESIRKIYEDERSSASGPTISMAVANGLDSELQLIQGGTPFYRRRGHIYSWDATSKATVTVLDDTNSPREVFACSTSGGPLRQLSNHGRGLQNQKFGTPKFLSCTSRSVDGEPPVRLDFVFVVPHNHKTSADGKPDRPLPTVLHIHGGPYGRVTDEFNPSEYMWTPALLAKGYGILTVNYRCGSGRGQDFAQVMRGGVGIYDYSDVIEMVQNAIKEGFADKDNIIVAGWSHGGMLTYLCCTRNGQHGYGWKFKGAIAGAGGTNWDTLTFTSDVGIWKGWLSGKAPWEKDKSDVSDRRGSAIYEFKDAVERKAIPPMLILHPELDRRVPVEQAVGFRRALINAKLPFEYVVYPREPHMMEESAHWLDMMERVLSFVDRHIGG